MGTVDSRRVLGLRMIYDCQFYWHTTYAPVYNSIEIPHTLRRTTNKRNLLNHHQTYIRMINIKYNNCIIHTHPQTCIHTYTYTQTYANTYTWIHLSEMLKSDSSERLQDKSGATFQCFVCEQKHVLGVCPSCCMCHNPKLHS